MLPVDKKKEVATTSPFYLFIYLLMLGSTDHVNIIPNYRIFTKPRQEIDKNVYQVCENKNRIGTACPSEMLLVIEEVRMIVSIIMQYRNEEKKRKSYISEHKQKHIFYICLSCYESIGDIVYLFCFSRFQYTHMIYIFISLFYTDLMGTLYTRRKEHI